VLTRVGPAATRGKIPQAGAPLADEPGNRGKAMRNFIEDESGTTLIEYALIASMMTMLLAGALSTLQTGVNELFRLVTVFAGDRVG